MLDDTQLRLSIFIGVLVVMAALEAILPKRQRQQNRAQRWTTNLSLVFFNSIVLKLLGPVSAVVAADYALTHNWGLIARSPVALPLFVEIIIAIVFLDFVIYIQHVASHRIPILWRLHQVHHADRDIDVTTGVRFHPLEVFLSMIYKCCVILALGPITIAVVIFEVLLNASAMFNHANVRLPKMLDRMLRAIIVTPDFHRVHHSVLEKETNSNYGFFLSTWDKLCNTYIPQPRDNHHDMTIGLTAYQSSGPGKLLWCLSIPFKPLVKESK